MEKIVDSKEVGLAVGYLFSKHFLKTEDLHYGIWNDLEPTVENLPLAQKKHSDFILSHFPQNTRSVLDVGSGGGNFAKRLLEEGYIVDCISPSYFLSQKVKDKVGEQSSIYRCKLEEFSTEKKYDLILFSESFQYMDLERVFAQCRAFLDTKGSILICDFFEKENADGPSPLGGGHALPQFFSKLKQFHFQIEKDIDITEATAPTMEVFGSLLSEVALPIRDLVRDFLGHRHPFLMKLLSWKFKKRFQKLDHKFFSGALNGQSFSKYKSYRLFLLHSERISSAV